MRAFKRAEPRAAFGEPAACRGSLVRESDGGRAVTACGTVGLKTAAPPGVDPGGAVKPAMTYFRAVRTIIGPGCLTAVFGMGTGVSSPVWSPASRSASRRVCQLAVVRVAWFPASLPSGGLVSRGIRGALLRPALA